MWALVTVTEEDNTTASPDRTACSLPPPAGDRTTGARQEAREPRLQRSVPRARAGGPFVQRSDKASHRKRPAWEETEGVRGPAARHSSGHEATRTHGGGPGPARGGGGRDG